MSTVDPQSQALVELPEEEREILLKVADVLRRIEFGDGAAGRPGR